MADIESSYTLDVKNVLDGLDQIIARLDKVEKAGEKAARNNPFKEAIKGSETFEKRVSSNLNEMVRTGAMVKSIKEELSRYTVTQAKLTEEQKKFIDSAKYQKVKNELSKVSAELKSVNKELAEATKKSEESTSALGKLAGVATRVNTALQAFVGLKAVQYVFNLGKSVFDTTAKFEKYSKVLETALGSQDLSNQAMQALKKIAAETAFSMDELTNGYVKMVNRGLRPSTQEIIKLTDLAASQGKSFDQLVEAVLDAQTGEFERLKEFGIRAKKAGDEIALAFKGQTAAVKDNERAIYDAIVAMGAINGVAGQNAELMSTLDGKVSNLGDSIDDVSTKFGTIFKPVFDGILSGLSKGVSFLGDIAIGFGNWAGITDQTETALSALNDQQRVTFESERKLQPLIARYEELKGKTTLNKNEQEELRKVIAEIQKIVPQAATAFDTYGKALDINKEKVRDYLSQNTKLTKEMKALAAENIGNELNELSKKQLVLNRELQQGYQEIYEHGVRSEQKLTNEQIVKRQIDLNDIKNKTIQLRRALRGLDGSGTPSGNLPTSGASDTGVAAISIDKKATDARKRALEDAEKDLQGALLKLENEYGKDKLESLKNNELERIKLKKQQDRSAIDEEEKFFLKIKQIEAGAQKGNFDKNNKIIPDKSVTLSAVERDKYAFRRSLVDDRGDEEVNAHYKKQAETISDGEKNITELLSNEYQLQLQAIERKYENALKLSENDGKKRLQLEKKKEDDIKNATLDRDLKEVDNQKSLEMQSAELSVLQAQIDGRIDMELNARSQLLEIERKYNEKKLKIIEAAGVKDINARVLPLRKANKEIEKDQRVILNKLQKFAQKFTLDYWLNKIRGMTPEGIEAVKYANMSISQSVSELYSTLNQLSQQRISKLDEEISKKEQQVETEQELSEQGVANNLSLRQKELSDLKDQRERALKDQARTAKQQQIIETATQASSMISAAAKVFSSLAGLPFGAGVPLGIAAVALMLGSFAAAKVKAFQLINSQDKQYRKGGLIDGPLHEQGGVKVFNGSANGVEVEGGEWVINRKSSAKYNDLLEAINNNNGSGVLDYLIHDMLANTGVTLSEPGRREDLRFMREYKNAITGSDNDLINEVRELKNELAEIKKNTNRIPKSQLVNAGPGQYAEISPNSTVVRTLPKY